jgi:hypothetical protein
MELFLQGFVLLVLEGCLLLQTLDLVLGLVYQLEMALPYVEGLLTVSISEFCL